MGIYGKLFDLGFPEMVSFRFRKGWKLSTFEHNLTNLKHQKCFPGIRLQQRVRWVFRGNHSNLNGSSILHIPCCRRHGDCVLTVERNQNYFVTSQISRAAWFCRSSCSDRSTCTGVRNIPLKRNTGGKPSRLAANFFAFAADSNVQKAF